MIRYTKGEAAPPESLSAQKPAKPSKRPVTAETLSTDEEPNGGMMGEANPEKGKPSGLSVDRPAEKGRGHETPSDRAEQNAEVAKATNEIAGGT